jgi:hypothetical protein
MLALSGVGDRIGAPRRSPVEIIAIMGTYITRTQAAGVSGLRTGPFGRWADGVTAMREDCAAYARYWQAHNDQVLTMDGPLWVVLGDSTAQGLGAPSPDGGYVGQAAAARDLPVAEVSAHFLPPWTGKFASDCFHPSPAGHRDWARALLAAVASTPVRSALKI